MEERWNGVQSKTSTIIIYSTTSLSTKIVKNKRATKILLGSPLILMRHISIGRNNNSIAPIKIYILKCELFMRKK
jgi:hypothetical protein